METLTSKERAALRAAADRTEFKKHMRLFLVSLLTGGLIAGTLVGLALLVAGI